VPGPRRFTADRIAGLVHGTLRGSPDILLSGVAPLDGAGPSDLAFLASSRSVEPFRRSGAGAVLVPRDFVHPGSGPATCIAVGDPQRAMRSAIQAFYPEPAPRWGLGAHVRIGAGARWEGRIALGDGARLGRSVRLGRECVIETGAVLADGVTLGDHCRVGAHAVLERDAVLGHRVRVAPGARVGGDGFSYVATEGGHEPFPHVGRCVIQDDVDIGANAVVDRGSLGETFIGRGTKIDSLVKVAHNVRIGARCLIMAQVGIAGSATVDDDAVLAGQAGLADHTHVERGARVAAQGGVIGRVPAGVTVSGYPARDHRDVLRQAAALKRLAPIVTTLEALARSHAPGTD
jgi:UDP-3-O-[3-hydroxymyristoyl] glucosamine N-acyltransferase